MRLSNRETLAMASYILGTEVMGEELEELILEKTEGIPFFVEEFMKSLKDLGMIEWRDSGYYLAKDIQEVEIPSTIQEVIMARVDSLPDGAKGVLQTGSAIGREFSCELIKRVTGIPTPEMTPHLSVLRDSELLYERGIFPQATYIFRHSLTQEVAYDSLLQKKKQDIHDRIGQAIEELYSDRLEEFYEILAHHYSRSENHEKAYQYLKLSGEKAIWKYSSWEAFRFHKEAINVLNMLPDNEQRKRRGIEVRLSMQTPMIRLGYMGDSIEILKQGETICREVGDEKNLAEFAGTIGVAYAVRGNTVQARKYNETAFWAAESTDDIDLIARTGFALCSLYIVEGSYLDIIKVASHVIPRLESSGREAIIYSANQGNIYSLFLGWYGCSIGFQGDFEKGAALCEKGLTYALQVNNKTSAAYVEFMLGSLFVIKGDGQSGAEHYKSCVGYTEETQDYILMGVAWVFLGWADIQLGELENAQQSIEKGLKIYQDIGMPDLLAHITYGGLGMVLTNKGNLETARINLDKSIKAAKDSNARLWEAWWRVWLARTYNWNEASEASEAEANLLQATDIFRELEMKPWYAIAYSELGALYIDKGPKEKALEILKKAEGMMQEMGMIGYWLHRTQEVLARVGAA
jgi:predicted ATPase